MKIDFDRIDLWMDKSKSITRTMAAEFIFYTIMFVVFVGYIVVMRFINGMKQPTAHSRDHLF
jgi:hypothetical protein